jgi:hypothetical protein
LREADGAGGEILLGVRGSAVRRGQ